MIDSIGLLKKKGLIHLHELYKLWTQRSVEKRDRLEMLGKFYEKTFPSSSDMLSQRIEQLQQFGHLNRVVKIRACAVWDTVSALGNPLVNSVKAPRDAASSHSALPRVDTHVPESVELAFHALALHEYRKHFLPDTWTSHNSQKTLLKQCWFLGAHSDVGGGNEDSGLASIALIWMLSQLSSIARVEFDAATIKEVVNPSKWEWPSETRPLWVDIGDYGIGAQIRTMVQPVLASIRTAVTGEGHMRITPTMYLQLTHRQAK